MKRILSLVVASAAFALCSCHTTGSTGAACCASGACATGANGTAATCKVCGKPAASCVCKQHKH